MLQVQTTDGLYPKYYPSVRRNKNSICIIEREYGQVGYHVDLE
ncbi:hypothetical protein [Bacillus thuringiensis]